MTPTDVYTFQKGTFHMGQNRPIATIPSAPLTATIAPVSAPIYTPTARPR